MLSPSCGGTHGDMFSGNMPGFANELMMCVSLVTRWWAAGLSPPCKLCWGWWIVYLVLGWLCLWSCMHPV